MRRPGPGRYQFVLRPQWLLSHVLVLAGVVVMVNLGAWQLRRMHDRQACNDLRRDNAGAAPVPVAEVLVPGAGVDLIDNDDFDCRGPIARTVTAVGTYVVGDEVIIRNRSLTGRAGVWVATPLRLQDGNAVLVVRGFVPSPGGLDEVPEGAGPPAGTVMVTGYVQGTQARDRFGPAEPSEGRLGSLARVDVERVERQLDYPLLPGFVQLAQSSPAGGPFPEPVPVPGTTDGPHLAYAVQWFAFSAIAVVGYPLALRRRARPPSGGGGGARREPSDARSKP
ncbi:MAG: SURF1 family cytochrome oxidase biogenesis protein [Acidimicrobiia bacterium]